MTDDLDIPGFLDRRTKKPEAPPPRTEPTIDDNRALELLKFLGVKLVRHKNGEFSATCDDAEIVERAENLQAVLWGVWWHNQPKIFGTACGIVTHDQTGKLQPGDPMPEEDPETEKAAVNIWLNEQVAEMWTLLNGEALPASGPRLPASLETGLPLDQLVRTINVLVGKLEKVEEKAQQFNATIGQHLKDLKARKPKDLIWVEWLEQCGVKLKQSRADELIRIADGRSRSRRAALASPSGRRKLSRRSQCSGALRLNRRMRTTALNAPLPKRLAALAFSMSPQQHAPTLPITTSPVT